MFVCLVLTLSVAILFTSCDFSNLGGIGSGNNGGNADGDGNTDGTDDKDDGGSGDSADGSTDDYEESVVAYVYAKATEMGFEGTLDEFLELVKGSDGKNGRGILDVTITDGELLVHMSDDTVINLGPIGADGKDGKDGEDGKDGKDGETPYIGANGNWWIGERDTGVSATPGGATTKCTVTFYLDEYNTVTKEVDFGDRVVPPEVEDTDEGIFMYWLYKETLWLLEPAEVFFVWDSTSPITKNMEIYAMCSTECTVTFDSDGGTPVAPQTVFAGECIVEPEDPVKEGCTFYGWYLEDYSWDFEWPVYEDMTLTAAWDVPEYDDDVFIYDFEDLEEEQNSLVGGVMQSVNLPDGITQVRSEKGSGDNFLKEDCFGIRENGGNKVLWLNGIGNVKGQNGGGRHARIQVAPYEMGVVNDVFTVAMDINVLEYEANGIVLMLYVEGDADNDAGVEGFLSFVEEGGEKYLVIPEWFGDARLGTVGELIEFSLEYYAEDGSLYAYNGFELVGETYIGEGLDFINFEIQVTVPTVCEVELDNIMVIKLDLAY